jgi:hypothetical protein
MFFRVLLVLLIGIGIAVYEVPRLMQEQMKRELIAFGGFLLIGVILALALTLDLPIPNPTRAIEYAFGPLERLIYPR